MTETRRGEEHLHCRGRQRQAGLQRAPFAEHDAEVLDEDVDRAGDRRVGLQHARAAVAQVAGDEQFIACEVADEPGRGADRAPVVVVAPSLPMSTPLRPLAVIVLPTSMTFWLDG